LENRRFFNQGLKHPSWIITALFRNQPFDGGSSAINRLARSARALASFASYADQHLSDTEIVSRGPERHSDLGKTETS
jgi:hypothetical protein